MNKIVCAFGVILILLSVLVMTKSEIFSGQYENPPTQWTIQPQPVSESPQGWIAKCVSIIPFTFMGAIVFLLGLITLIVGSQMSKKRKST